MYFISFCGGCFFVVSTISWHFFELGHFNIDVFFFLFVFIIPNRVMLFLFIIGMDVLPRHVDQESSHDTSVVASHVDHVVGLGVFDLSQISSFGQNVVNLFFFSLGETKDVCF